MTDRDRDSVKQLRHRLAEAATALSPYLVIITASGPYLPSPAMFWVLAALYVSASLLLARISVVRPDGRVARLVRSTAGAFRGAAVHGWRLLAVRREPPGPVPDRPPARRASAVAGRTAIALAGTAVGAGAMLGVSGLATLVRSAVGPCPPPVQLRVATAAENLAAAEALTGQFVHEHLAAGGCAPVRFTVEEQPPLAAMVKGAQTGWHDRARADGPHVSLIGLHPDVWLAAGTATADHVLAAYANHTSVAELRRLGPVAASPLVVAVTPELAQRLEATGAATDTVADFEPHGLIRPRADLSEVALIATAGLYADPSGDVARELALTPPGLPLTDAAALLCHVRERLAAGADDGQAMVVPEHLVLAFNDDQALGPCGPGRAGPDLTMYRPGDLPNLTYELVEAKWPGQDLPERRRWIRALHAWLAERGMQEYGYRTPTGEFRGRNSPLGDRVDVRDERIGDVGALMDRVSRAHPPMTTLLALDVSGSMDDVPAEGGPALETARSAARELLRRLRDGHDTAGLVTFSEPDGGAPVREQPGATLDDLATALQRVTAEGRDALLGQVLDEAARRLDGEPNPVVVMLTDGGSRTGPAGRLAEVTGLEVVLLLTGGQECAAPHLQPLLEEAGEAVHCRRIRPGQDPSDVVHEELVRLWQRER
ncbi:VWA domain-containing protein [Thermoactinospora rubra]|uniref:VWA domain-containing protein n=1 Tax=Thermoactinospora rubra TaxID=1088767 RepID=UPI000A0FE20D|nr:VWA domain-containing protein [Thermoactinospora rubra]